MQFKVILLCATPKKQFKTMWVANNWNLNYVYSIVWSGFLGKDQPTFFYLHPPSFPQDSSFHPIRVIQIVHNFTYFHFKDFSHLSQLKDFGFGQPQFYGVSLFLSLSHTHTHTNLYFIYLSRLVYFSKGRYRFLVSFEIYD